MARPLNRAERKELAGLLMDYCDAVVKGIDSPPGEVRAARETIQYWIEAR